MGTIYFPNVDAFELYHRVKEENQQNGASTTSNQIIRSVKDGLAGAAGASVSKAITYPLDLIITRLQIQRQFRKNSKEPGDKEYTGLLDAAQKIYNSDDGLTGFYTGLLSATGKTLADSFIFFLLYDYLRRGRLQKNGQKLSLPAYEELSVGFVAGAATKLVTTPIANVATRQQAFAFSNPDDKTPSFMRIANKIRQEDGVYGFWSGYSASLVLTLNPSLTFFLFEFFKRVALPRSKRENPPAYATFFLAALSKACASSVTYPFSLAKSRLQAGGASSKKENEKEEHMVDEKVKSNNKKLEKAERKAAKKTLFSTLLTIYETEGVPALYEGLHLEVLKAFLSHGITMSVKQAIAKLIAKLSYTFGIVFSQYSRKMSRKASRLAERAKDTSVGYYDLSIKRVNDKVQEATEAAKTKANEVAEFVSEYVEEDDGEGWKELYGTVGLAKWLDERFNDPES